jgi:hypothetical protein
VAADERAVCGRPADVKAAQAQFAAAVGTPDEAAAEVHYRRATVSPRRRLLQRFSAFNPDGIRFLVDLRAELLPHLKADKRLQALDVEMEYMFSTWFDVGFLELRRISWDSPASLIEKLIKYEAVHDIKQLGRREEPAGLRPPLLRLLPPPPARRAADFCGGGASWTTWPTASRRCWTKGRARRPARGHHGDLLFHQQHADRGCAA